MALHQYSISQHFFFDTLTGISLILGGNSSYQNTFSGLTPRFTYVLILQALTSQGPSALSQNLTIQTLEDVPVKPSIPMLGAAQALNLTISWNAPSYTDSNGAIIGKA